MTRRHASVCRENVWSLPAIQWTIIDMPAFDMLAWPEGNDIRPSRIRFSCRTSDPYMHARAHACIHEHGRARPRAHPLSPGACARACLHSCTCTCTCTCTHAPPVSDPTLHSLSCTSPPLHARTDVRTHARTHARARARARAHVVNTYARKHQYISRSNARNEVRPEASTRHFKCDCRKAGEADREHER